MDCVISKEDFLNKENKVLNSIEEARQRMSASLKQKDFIKEQYSLYNRQWEELKNSQEIVVSRLDQLWESQSQLLQSQSTLQTQLDSLSTQCETKKSKLSESQDSRNALEEEIQQQKNQLVELAKTVMIQNPTDKFMHQLLQNITRISWDSECIEQNDSIKGQTITASGKIKHFSYNSAQKSAEEICEGIWKTIEDESAQ